jgi:hypothetical protein
MEDRYTFTSEGGVMPELHLHNEKIDSIFQLLGEKENDITYSVGWALSRSPAFLSAFLKTVGEPTDRIDQITIRLQDYRKNQGVTDIEIELPGYFHIIVEAKDGWSLPKRRQLRKYSRRFWAAQARSRRFVILSEYSSEYAKRNLDYKKIRRIPVSAFSWRQIAELAKVALPHGTSAEKRLLRDLLLYLGRITIMQNLQSNMVYVVALSSETNRGWKISWIDIVEKLRRYFHAAGTGGWPKEPPNYIGFRYKGMLQSIHHIEGHEIVTNLHKVSPKIPTGLWVPMFVYRLGPAIRPKKPVKTGRIFRNGRVWCMLDTLLISKTISAARDLTRKRLAKLESVGK